MSKLLVLVLLVSIMFSSGCLEAIKQKVKLLNDAQEYVSTYSSEEVKTSINNKKILIGMKQPEVVASIGFAYTMNNSVSKYGERSQWVYYTGDYVRYKYVYFTDYEYGYLVVTSWQN